MRLQMPKYISSAIVDFDTRDRGLVCGDPCFFCSPSSQPPVTFSHYLQILPMSSSTGNVIVLRSLAKKLTSFSNRGITGELQLQQSYRQNLFKIGA